MNLLPKFSIRQLFILLAVASLVLLFASNAYQRGMVGTAMTASVILLIPCLLMLAIVYWVGWAISTVEQRLFARRLRRPPYGNPSDSNESHRAINSPVPSAPLTSSNPLTSSTIYPPSPSDPHAGLWWCGLICAGLILATSNKVALALQSVPYSSQAMVMVNPQLSPDAMQVIIDDQFPRAELGLRYLRVTVSTHSQLPVKRDQDFTICFDSPNHYYGDVSSKFFKHATIPAGSASVTTEVYISSNISSYDNYRMTLGRGRWNGLPPRSQQEMVYYSSQSNVQKNQKTPTLLISAAVNPTLGVRRFVADRGESRNESISATQVDQERLPDLNGLMQLELDPNTRYQLPHLNENGFHACHPDDLPSSWIGLSSIERIFVTAEELEDLIDNSPFHRLTINSWLAAGGALVILDAGDSVTRYDDLITRLTLPLNRSESSLLDSQPVVSMNQRKWIYPTSTQVEIDKKLVGVEIGQQQNYYYSPGSNPTLDESLEVNKFLKVENLSQSVLWETFDIDSLADSATNPVPPFMLTDHNRGQVIMVSADTNNWDADDWRKLANSIQLKGLSIRGLVRSNQQTYENEVFAIEGVGEPPLVLFQLLMMLFVIVAGPVVFIVLKRSRNLQLMFLIVPAISLTACLGMVGNATFIEGFGSQGRLDSVTWLDHRTDSAVTQVRACYYHGRSPGEYQFAPDILPMDFQNTELSPSLAGFRVQLKSDATAIAGGNIKSRTPHQIASVRSYQQGKQFHWQANENEALGSFQNDLGTELRLVIARNKDGWIIAEDLADGQSAAGQAVSETQLSQIVTDLAKTMSPRTYNYNYNQSRSWNRSYRYRSYRSFSSPAPIQANLGGEFDVVSAMQNQLGWQELIPDSGYLAICVSSPYIDRQVVDSPTPEFKHQFHVIIGKW